MQKKWPMVGLGLLAVVTLVLMALALLHVRPTSTAAIPADPAATAAPETSPAAAEDPGSPAPTDRRETPGAPRESTLPEIKEALAGPVRIAVVGDITGMDEPDVGATRWVTLWAQQLAEDRPVQLHKATAVGRFAAPERLGSGTGAPIDILNASNQPALLDAIIADAGSLVPPETDLVIVNVGHTEAEAELADNLTSLREEVPATTMMLVMLQNPQRGGGQAAQQARVEAVRSWAQRNNVASVDVHRAFFNDPRPLAQLVLEDGKTPSRVGAQAWRDAMAAALA
ncbi:MAG: SGNH/GDSL hydrolase family protein [Propionibacteriaceae bacterium]|nr:SGNH/GDSL hydrolase family protein [Propionibacteriaceae bacterium]